MRQKLNKIEQKRGKLKCARQLRAALDQNNMLERTESRLKSAKNGLK